MTSDHRRFRNHFIFFAGLQVCIAVLVWRYGAAGGSQHYLAAFQDKLQRLKSVEGRRMIFVGGSNLAFGIHSEMVEESGGAAPVNLGLFAPLGLQYQLEMVRRHARAGDQVIVVPELEMFDAGLQPDSPSSVDELIHLNENAALYFCRDAAVSYKRFLDVTSLEIAHQYVGRAYNAVTRSSRVRLYARESFNEFGDMVAHRQLPAKSKIEVQQVHLDQNETMDASIQILNRFAGDCRQRGIEVRFGFPPIPRPRFDKYATTIKAFENRLRQDLQMPILQSTRETTRPADEFHDSNYHLTYDSGAKRTRRLLESIQRVADHSPAAMRR